jgi:hypothetical protein
MDDVHRRLELGKRRRRLGNGRLAWPARDLGTQRYGKDEGRDEDGDECAHRRKPVWQGWRAKINTRLRQY